MVAIDAGAEDIAIDDDVFEVICEPTDLTAVREALDEAGVEIETRRGRPAAEDARAARRGRRGQAPAADRRARGPGRRRRRARELRRRRRDSRARRGLIGPPVEASAAYPAIALDLVADLAVPDRPDGARQRRHVARRAARADLPRLAGSPTRRSPSMGPYLLVLIGLPVGMVDRRQVPRRARPLPQPAHRPRATAAAARRAVDDARCAASASATPPRRRARQGDDRLRRASRSWLFARLVLRLRRLARCPSA